MRAFADFAIDDFLESIDALGRVCRVGDVHKMHAEIHLLAMFLCKARRPKKGCPKCLHT